MIGNRDTETQVLEGGHKYDISINKISTKLLEKPYKTMCYNYDKKYSEIKSRKQCIDDCVLRLYKDNCNCIPTHLTNTLQLLNSSANTVCSRIVSDLCFTQ